MTRAELISLMEERLQHIPAHQVEIWVKAFFEYISKQLEAGHRIELRGFGSFFVKHRPPRMTKNPRTGIWTQTAHRSIPRFKAGKELREMVHRNNHRYKEQPKSAPV